MNTVLKYVDPKLFIRKSVKQLISGYDDPLMTIANLFFPNLVNTRQFSLLRGVMHDKKNYCF